jgi:hypothetical protein
VGESLVIIFYCPILAHLLYGEMDENEMGEKHSVTFFV